MSDARYALSPVAPVVRQFLEDYNKRNLMDAMLTSPLRSAFFNPSKFEVDSTKLHEFFASEHYPHMVVEYLEVNVNQQTNDNHLSDLNNDALRNTTLVLNGHRQTISFSLGKLLSSIPMGTIVLAHMRLASWMLKGYHFKQKHRILIDIEYEIPDADRNALDTTKFWQDVFQGDLVYLSDIRSHIPPRYLLVAPMFFRTPVRVVYIGEGLLTPFETLLFIRNCHQTQNKVEKLYVALLDDYNSTYQGEDFVRLTEDQITRISETTSRDQPVRYNWTVHFKTLCTDAMTFNMMNWFTGLFSLLLNRRILIKKLVFESTSNLKVPTAFQLLCQNHMLRVYEQATFILDRLPPLETQYWHLLSQVVKNENNDRHPLCRSLTRTDNVLVYVRDGHQKEINFTRSAPDILGSMVDTIRVEKCPNFRDDLRYTTGEEWMNEEIMMFPPHHAVPKWMRE